MARATIDYGIDLGTTNSAVAVFDGVSPRVVPNREGAAFTPSAVWIDKRGRLFVGRRARERADIDPPNAAVEFKLKMGLGSDGEMRFADANRRMLPEELSAEVLKELRLAIKQSSGEDIHAAAITVPAAFELDQCDATRRAAELAGFRLSPLLQEPVAAALAYGFQSESDRVFWLVYDFGGGTFDAAVIQVRDGVIQVVNHAGDNHLGGKLIDWDIVEKRFMPALLASGLPGGVRRGDDPWRWLFAKLKSRAEEAKIRVSATGEPFDCWMDDLRDPGTGATFELEYELTAEDLEELADPYVTRSVNLCRRALDESKLAPSDIEKVILVGGSSLLPSLRQRVGRELGAMLEHSHDPITVVARGAAVFAGTQKLTAAQPRASAGQYAVALEYEPVGSDTDPLVGGRVTGPGGASVQGFAIELIEGRSQWRSGKIPIGKNGAFVTQVHAERGRRCEFLIQLSDKTGTTCVTVPDRFAYTVGMVITSAPLTHDVGVAMANNKMDPFFKKGAALPARRMRTHQTTGLVRRGAEADEIRIPVVEGENLLRADRNTLIGYLVIKGADPRVKRDVPTGTQVEITIEIDESRQSKAKAYIPILDAEFVGVMTFDRKQASVPNLREDFDREMLRLADVESKAQQVEAPKARVALDRIEREDMIGQIESLLRAAEGDREVVPECDKRLRDLKTAIDVAEDALEWPALTRRAHEELNDTRSLVGQYGEPDEADEFRRLESDARRAVDSGDIDSLRTQVENIERLQWRVRLRRPETWIDYLAYLEEHRAEMRDHSQAERLLTQARRAIDAEDLDSLRAACRQLGGLLPEEQDRPPAGLGGTTIRWDI